MEKTSMRPSRRPLPAWLIVLGGLSLAATTAAAAAAATPVPLGDAFVLASPQGAPGFCFDDAPLAVGSPGGRFLAAWVERCVHPPQSGTLLARLFRAAGAAPRPPVEVNTGLPPLADAAAGTIDAQGDYLLTWSNRSAQPAGVFARRLSAYGGPLTDPIAVAVPADSPPFSESVAPAIAAAPDGGFVVAWASSVVPVPGIPEGSAPVIIARRFDAAGAPAGDPIVLSQSAVGDQGPALCADSDGGTVAVWVSARTHLPQQPPTGAGVSARRLSADGSLVGDEIVVAPPNGQLAAAAVGCEQAASFLVAWQSDQVAGAAGFAILAQRFNRAGQPVGNGPHRVDATSTGDQKAPALSRAPDGTFIVVWVSEQPDGAHLVGRRVNSRGTPLSNEFEIAKGIEPGQHPAVTHNGASGTFVVAWTQAGQLLARRYAPGP